MSSLRDENEEGTIRGSGAQIEGRLLGENMNPFEE